MRFLITMQTMLCGRVREALTSCSGAGRAPEEGVRPLRRRRPQSPPQASARPAEGCLLRSPQSACAARRGAALPPAGRLAAPPDSARPSAAARPPHSGQRRQVNSAQVSLYFKQHPAKSWRRAYCAYYVMCCHCSLKSFHAWDRPLNAEKHEGMLGQIEQSLSQTSLLRPGG